MDFITHVGSVSGSTNDGGMRVIDKSLILVFVPLSVVTSRNFATQKITNHVLIVVWFFRILFLIGTMFQEE
jgi:hypothetical protein